MLNVNYKTECTKQWNLDIKGFTFSRIETHRSCITYSMEGMVVIRTRQKGIVAYQRVVCINVPLHCITLQAAGICSPGGIASIIVCRS